ncbi:hypothetical protein ACIQMP_07705 [Streptomyces sp. NPDC091385]|uniref:hypothetical protein n=1 Tax=Streptomyces sp. NPDC091385 TaxID=3365997 RepID=UPI00380D81D0
MAALPGTVTVACPVCDAPVVLPLHADVSDATPTQGQMVVALSADVEPLKTHFATTGHVPQPPPQDESSSVFLPDAISGSLRKALRRALTIDTNRDALRARRWRPE